MNILLVRFRASALVFLLIITSSSWASLSGHLVVGANGDFASLREALDSVMFQGLQGDLKLSITSERESGPFILREFDGNESFTLTLTGFEGAPVSLVSSDSTAPTLQVINTHNIEFQRLALSSPAPLQPAIIVSGSSSDIVFSNCSITARTNTRAIEVLGPDTRNVNFDKCEIRRASEGIYLDGQSVSASGNSITNCTIDSVQQGIYISKQSNCLVSDCFIKPNLGLGGGATAVTVGAQNAYDSVFVLGNSLSQVKTSSGYAVAVRHNPISSQAYLQFSNNFVFDFQNTGSSQIRAVFLSGGQNRIVNNSILVNDVAATGTAYTIYDGLIAPDAKLSLLNNILANQEATRPAYNVFVLTQAAQIASNNNLFYGTGSAYKIGWFLSPYTTLAEWKNTGLDLASFEGNPLFVSATDLHLQSSSELAHQNGAVALDVPWDIDYKRRFQPPDIGADEYLFDAPAHDLAILDILGIPQSFPEYSLLRLEVVVQNRGSAEVNDIPLRLSYDDTARAEAIIDLNSSDTDTFLLVWSTASARPSSELVVEAILGTDANPVNNAVPFNLAVTGIPMSGAYQVGGFTGDFVTLSDALAELNQRGVDGPVVLEIESGIYAENFVLTDVPGLSSTSTLTIRQSPMSEGVVQLSPSGGNQTVLLSNVSYVTLEGLIIQGGSSTIETIKLTNNSHHNTILNCRLNCASLEQSNATTLLVTAGCSDNLFEQLDISTAYNGIRFDGASSQSAGGNIVRDCRISNVRTAIQASWQRNLMIENCDIATGFNNAPSPCYGIRILNTAALDTVRIFENKIENCLAAGTITAISCESGSGTVLVANNWIGNFDPATSGFVTALTVTSGTTLFYHNSISLGNVASMALTGISVSGSQTSARLLNNIVQVTDPNATARFIEWTGGDIVADHNLYDAPGMNTQFRFAHSSLDGEFQSLGAWTEATGQDSSSIANQAGFQIPSDYHLRPDASGPSNRAIFVAEVPFDADGEVRDSLPDIGCDEFSYEGALIDLAVQSIMIPNIPVSSGTPVQIYSILGNVGQTNVESSQAILYFNEVPLDTQVFSLDLESEIELSWDWFAPSAELAYGSIRVTVYAVNDAVAANDSKSQSVVVAGASLSDTVQVGGSRSNFSSLSELAEHLKWRGTAGELHVLLAPGTHQGPLVLEAIPGADSLNRIVIEPLDIEGATITAANSEAVVIFRNAEYISLERVGVVAGIGTPYGVSMDNMSCQNVVSGCIVEGSGTDDLSTVGIRVTGSDCQSNQIIGNTVTASYIGVALTSANQSISHGNIVSENEISDVYYGIWVDHQHQALISDNHIRPGSNLGQAGACYGIYILQLGENGTLRVEGNQIHDFLDSSGPRTNRACGIYSAPGITSSVDIVNNFIFGFSQLTTLRSRGIYLSSGNHLVANNSIRLDDSPADNDNSGIFVSTGTQHEIYNNCIMGYENDVPSYGLDIESGADVISDYNCIWGNSSNFYIAGFGSQNFSSLASWQATGQDAQSLSLHARYVSPTDLHVQVTDTAMFANGVSLPQITDDIDGDMRAATPCIGADEYTLLIELSPPLGLTITPVGETEVLLSWLPVTGASEYKIYGAITPELLETSPLELGASTTTTWTWDFSADPESVRFFNVRAQ